MTGPLAGLRIIEFAGLGPGPFCAMMLADHGAEVIRIDRIGATGLVQEADKDFLLRSRRSFEVDLKNPDGVALARRLCQSADAIIEGFRPGVMERIGLGPEVLLRDHPRLVYGRMTGFGQEGPYASMAGHDINYIALSGALHAIGSTDGPPTPPLNLVGDFGGGGMMLAFGMVAAILSAQATGRGQVVDAAMTDGSALLMAMVYSLRADGLWADRRGANIVDGGSHFYGAYETADGKYVSIGPVEPHFYRMLIEAIGLGDDMAMAVQNDPSLWPSQKARLAACFGSKTRDEWCALLEGTDVCFAPVMSLDEAPHHPHAIARTAFVEVGGTLHPAPSPRYSVTATEAPRPIAMGAGVAADVLREIGLDDAEIAHLAERKIIG